MSTEAMRKALGALEKFAAWSKAEANHTGVTFFKCIELLREADAARDEAIAALRAALAAPQPQPEQACPAVDPLTGEANGPECCGLKPNCDVREYCLEKAGASTEPLAWSCKRAEQWKSSHTGPGRCAAWCGNSETCVSSASPQPEQAAQANPEPRATGASVPASLGYTRGGMTAAELSGEQAAQAQSQAGQGELFNVALTHEQVSALYLTLTHGRFGGKERPETRPAFGWMEQPLCDVETLLEPIHSHIHDRRFNAMNRQFFGDNRMDLPVSPLPSAAPSPAASVVPQWHRVLRGLAANAGCLRAFEPEVRAAIGNTNWAAIAEYVRQADELLAASPSQEDRPAQPEARRVGLTEEQIDSVMRLVEQIIIDSELRGLGKPIKFGTTRVELLRALGIERAHGIPAAKAEGER